jgi:LuxR family transcriptional regulator, maltose regulon positive regulatory protein
VVTRTASPVAISRSKVERPTLSGQWVRRLQIETRLDRALARSLTVVTAPAGHGKTSTIVSWLDLRDIDAAWVTVDRRDAELTRFAAHVAVALDRVAPGIEAGLFSLLTAPDRLAPADLGDAFGEALYDLPRDVVLVLDDVHAVANGVVADFLVGLLRAAPRRLHTILSSRGKAPFPLSRLRTLGDVEELTGADLRFSIQETGDLVRLESGHAVKPGVAARLQASVGGWPAAIRLIAISRGASQAELLAEPISHDQEHLLLEYLGEEVLAQLRPAQREALLRASLVERFNAPLLGALAAAAGGEPLDHADIAQLRGLELFREIPGLSEVWFAYHVVFRAILRQELERLTGNDGIAGVHRLIARWFADAGLTREAIKHLVEAGDHAAAASLIESRLNDTFAREDWKSLAAWLQLIPMDAILQRPELLLASGWVAYLSGRDGRIAEVLQIMRDPAMQERVSAAQRAEIALLADWPVDDAAAIAAAETAIAHIPAVKRYRYGYAHLALGMALTSAGRTDEALSRLATFTDRESARIDAAAIRGYFGRVVVLWQAARLVQCQQTAADLLQLAQNNRLVVSAGWGAVFLGVVAHELGDLAQATRHFETVIAGADQFHFMGVRDAFFAQALIYLAQGRQDEADRAIARLRELVIATETHRQLETVDAFAARLALIRGELVTAQRWLASSSPALRHDDLKSLEHPQLTRIKVLITVDTGNALAEADGLLAEYLHEARATHMMLALLEGLAVQALLLDARGDRAAATQCLRESLDMAAPEGIVQRYAYLGPALAPLLRQLLSERPAHPHAGPVLGALEAVLATRPTRASSLPTLRPESLPQTPLTERESQVLRCLARRLTNDEIGQELFISPITVKNHIAHISEKFGVSGRRAAVAHASHLGILTAEA